MAYMDNIETEGELFIYAKQKGLFTFPPSEGYILLSSKQDKTYGIFTGENSEGRNPGSNKLETKYGTTYNGVIVGAWCSTHYVKWLAISPQNYEKLIIYRSEQEYNPPELPPVPIDCETGRYNIYRIYSRRDERGQELLPPLPDKYKDVIVYEQNLAFCVIAIDEPSARQLCNQRIETEYGYSEDFWLDPKWSACVLLGKASIELSMPQIIITKSSCC